MGRSGRNKGVFDFNVAIDAKRAVKGLLSVDAAHQKAKALAAAEAGDTALTKASAAIAKAAKVSYWQIRGSGVKPGGPKNTGSRVGRSRYVKSLDGIKIYLRHAHVNPVGTAKQQNPIEIKAASRTKTGKIRKGSASVKVRTTGGVHNYKNGVYLKGGYQGAVYVRGDGGQLVRQDIDIYQHRHLLESVGAPAYSKRFGVRWQKHFNYYKRQAIAGTRDRAMRRAFARSLGRR